MFEYSYIVGLIEIYIRSVIDYHDLPLVHLRTEHSTGNFVEDALKILESVQSLLTDSDNMIDIYLACFSFTRVLNLDSANDYREKIRRFAPPEKRAALEAIMESIRKP